MWPRFGSTPFFGRDFFWRRVMATTMDVAKKLVDLCQQGKFMQAVEELYAPNIVASALRLADRHDAAADGGDRGGQGQGEWWEKNHGGAPPRWKAPGRTGSGSSCGLILDVTGKSGPMAGKRMTLDETGLYTVKDGKIVQEEFFYFMG